LLGTLQVLIPNGRYKPQIPVNAVTNGIKPNSPHQLWKKTPTAPIIIPKMMRMILSVLPIFFFITYIFLFYAEQNNHLNGSRFHQRFPSIIFLAAASEGTKSK
jgi:hypothetical protein